MYEAVHAHPDGQSTVERLAETAADYGFEGVVVRNHSSARAEYDAEKIADEAGIDVVCGVEVRADDPQQASGAVGNHRTDETIVALEGGTNALNRFAVENDKVDVLADPMAESGDVNHVLAKAAAENGVRFEFNLAGVLRTHGGRRVRTIQSLRKLGEIVDYYDAPYVVSADPASHLELRAPANCSRWARSASRGSSSRRDSRSGDDSPSETDTSSPSRSLSRGRTGAI